MAKPKEPQRSGPKKKPSKKGEPNKGFIARIFSLFKGKDPRTPVKGFGVRIKNILFTHYRGLLGMLLPLAYLTWQGEYLLHSRTVHCMWIWMAWFFFMQPVAPPVTGIIPIFLLPMAGVLSTPVVCSCYMTENILLFILAGMLILLLNNSGVDRRIALSLLCSGDACQFAGKRLVFKCSTAAFFLSMLSNRLIVSSTLIQYMTKPLMDLQSATSKSRGTEPNYDIMRYIINNAIQTSSAIGSVAIMHSSYTVLCFRALWCESAPQGMEFPDIFNYFQYSAYAFPVAFLMFILNFSYHMLLINWCVGKAMSSSSMAEMRKALLNYKTALPRRVTLHEKLTVFFMIVTLMMFFLRWSRFLDMGWADFSAEKSSPSIPGLKDASVAAMMVTALHILPKGCSFFKYLAAEKKSELPPLKPESSILWWKFVDKNTNYGYIFLLGSGVALVTAIRDTGLGKIVAANLGTTISDHSWNVALLLVCFISIFMANIMTGVAACIVLLPYVLNLAKTPEVATTPAAFIGGEEILNEPVFRSSSSEWELKAYLGALGVGIGTSMGFMCPFLYTPAYFCMKTGKVPRKKMALYSIGSCVICLIILWLSLAFYAPFLWDPNNAGIVPVKAPGIITTTAAPDAAPEAPPTEAAPDNPPPDR